MRVGISKSLAVAFLLLSLCFNSWVIMTPTKGAGTPEIEIVLDQELQEADMESGDPVELIYTGRVNAEMALQVPNQVLVVTLQVSPGYYGYQFEPGQLVFNESGTRNFTLTLEVDLEVPSGENQMEVGGTWSYDPGFMEGSIPPTTSSVVVTPHPDLELIVPGPVDITEDESKDIPVKINNTGNVDVDFILEIEGVNRMENLGLEVILPAEEENTVEFSSFLTYNINLTGTGDIDGDSKADLDLFLLDADSGVRYQEASIVVEIREREEGGGNGDGGGDDDDDGEEGDGPGDGDDQNGDQGEDQTPEEVDQPRTLGSRVPIIIGLVAVVVIILAVVVYIIFRKAGKS